MDQYTQKTKVWLDERFQKTDNDGIYYAHQPIYGFRKGHSEATLTERYLCTYQIMKALSHLRFDSLLDVGSAEGYTAYVAQKLFNVKVECTDLSEEACKRAEEIFGIKATPADIHELPYENNEFDVLFCSETLEHVTDLEKATNEMLRVAKKALVITIPHEPKETVNKDIERERPHSHLYSFNLTSFNFITEKYGFKVIPKKINSSWIRIPAAIIDGMPREYTDRMPIPKIFIDINNLFVSITQRLVGKRTAVVLLQMDGLLCKVLPYFNNILFLILKNESCYTDNMGVRISALDVIDTTVPYYYLQKKE
jgi:SAM-dependent methyltransferase